MIALWKSSSIIAADLLEGAASDLDHLSEKIFGTQHKRQRRAMGRARTERLNALMRKIGVHRRSDLEGRRRSPRHGPHAALCRGQCRSLSFEADIRAKLKSLQRDIASLNDYETHLTDKIHFLLDATLGLTNIEQNNIFRILTIVSVVGIPPTFFASMWGMNFKNIPEYDWAYGYAFGLVRHRSERDHPDHLVQMARLVVDARAARGRRRLTEEELLARLLYRDGDDACDRQARRDRGSSRPEGRRKS